MDWMEIWQYSICRWAVCDVDIQPDFNCAVVHGSGN